MVDNDSWEAVEVEVQVRLLVNEGVKFVSGRTYILKQVKINGSWSSK